MPASYSTAFSHLVLAGTGTYCYLHISKDCACSFGFNFSKCSFAVIVINSVIGVWRHGNPSYGDDADNVYKFTSVLQDLVVLPCILSSLLVTYGYSDEIVFGSLFIPIVPLVSYFMDKKEVSSDLQNGITLVGCALLAYLSYTHQNYYGLAASASCLFNNFLVKKYKDDKFNIPTQDLCNYAMCFFAYFALRTLTD